MKRIYGFVLLCLLVVLTACSGPAATDEIPSGNAATPDASFYATVTSIDQRDVYVEVEDVLTGPSVEGELKIQTHRIDLSVYESIAVGDFIEVHYDGVIEGETPPQVKADVILVLQS